MNFMKYRYFYFLFSLCFLLPGFISLAVFGLKPSIDFTGGSLLEFSVPQSKEEALVTQQSVKQILGKDYSVISVQQDAANQYILRSQPMSDVQKNQVVASLQKKLGDVKELRFETVGPTLGKELLQKTLVAGVIVILIIVTYVWSQFHSLKFGVAAVVAMMHDACIVIGAFSILGKLFNVEVDVLFVTALLTILSFSVHDTIIVFDRIRETSRKHPSVPFVDVVNSAVLQTLGRSINNSMTIIIMLSALVLLGGPTIRWFAVALLIGAITGTYSSTFTAAPILLVWDEMKVKVEQSKHSQRKPKSV